MTSTNNQLPSQSKSFDNLNYSETSLEDEQIKNEVNNEICQVCKISKEYCIAKRYERMLRIKIQYFKSL